MNRQGLHAVAADHVFDGSTRHENALVLIEGSEIKSLLPQSELPADLCTHHLPAGAWLAPGFIDLQVNGGGDILFNDSPTPETIITIAGAHRKFGTTALLPTFITDTREKMRAAMAAVLVALDREPSVLGIHLEGPFLSPEKAGVHDPRLMRAPDEADLEMLCSEWGGQLLVTLAPERVPEGFIKRLTDSGRHVSFGHSMASYEETRSAMLEGLTGFTHLFNAMQPLQSRDPGPIAAALESSNAWYGLIVDGWHVNPAMLRLALRGCGHPMLVTDAMPPVGGRRSTFQLYGSEVRVVRGRSFRADGTLAGAALDMAAAVRNCRDLLHVSLPDALRFASRNPAEFIGVGNRLGRLAPGYRADMVAIDPEPVAVLGTWVAGESELIGSLPAATPRFT
jgi:N-acetylglucosamine-6-phosphate deacetylase